MRRYEMYCLPEEDVWGSEKYFLIADGERYYAFNFGMYKDESVTAIMQKDPKYIIWCILNK